MDTLREPHATVWPYPFTEQDWAQTPPAVPAYLHTLRDERGPLQERGENLEARLTQHSTPASRPPSSDAPYKKPRRRTGAKGSRNGGGTAGHAGHRQVLLAPTSVADLLPEPCACGSDEFDRISPSYTHQVLELPPIAREGTPWVWPQGCCQGCGHGRKARGPSEQATGYGPRLRARMGEWAGISGHGRRMVQSFCPAVLGVPISVGAIQKGLARVTQAIAPHDRLIATPARQAPVTDSEETPWDCANAWEGLWVMASAHVAFYMLHPRRAKDACFERMEEWAGLLVSAGDGV
jgi:transposase